MFPPIECGTATGGPDGIRRRNLPPDVMYQAMIAGFTALPAIIFDEVDTGVSGDIADKMGDIMQELGTKMQVFAITHLPQIAAKGKDHYFVYKEDTDERTVTRIRKMNKEERVKEIARMLSGASLTSASIANAKELLKSKNLTFSSRSGHNSNRV